MSDWTRVRSLARRKSKWTIGGCGALRRCGCAWTYEGTQFHCVKFRLGSAGEPTICSHCYDVLNEDVCLYNGENFKKCWVSDHFCTWWGRARLGTLGWGLWNWFPPMHYFHNFLNTCQLLNITFIFDRCCHSWAVVATVKYEWDSKLHLKNFPKL